MKNLTIKEQKQVLGGVYFKVFYQDGTYLDKVYSSSHVRNVIINYGKYGSYHVFQYNDSGSRINDWWERY